MAKKSANKVDISTLLGLLLATAGLIGGLLLEGGTVKDVAQVTAGLIVLGGTFGATMINTPKSVILSSIKRLKDVFFEQPSTTAAQLETIVDFASRARKNGIVALEEDANQVADPFLRKALTLAIDGTDVQEIRSMMELEIHIGEERCEAEARVYETAGGYAPTIGIIGAVMGLIQVMKHLENIEEVGHGIAVAFVATVYGVGLSNLFLLPAANKLKSRARDASRLKEMTLEGVIGIVEGLNPKLIRSKLGAYLAESPPVEKRGSAKRQAEAA